LLNPLQTSNIQAMQIKGNFLRDLKQRPENTFAKFERRSC